jgi:hypothetical protein
MRRKAHIMADLEKLCSALCVAESFSKNGRCTDAIRRARTLLQQILDGLAEEKRTVDWKTVSEVVRLLAQLYSLLRLIVL